MLDFITKSGVQFCNHHFGYLPVKVGHSSETQILNSGRFLMRYVILGKSFYIPRHQVQFQFKIKENKETKRKETKLKAISFKN